MNCGADAGVVLDDHGAPARLLVNLGLCGA